MTLNGQNAYTITGTQKVIRRRGAMFGSGYSFTNLLVQFVKLSK